LASKYSLVIAVSKRARQLRDGALPLVDIRSHNPITIAMEELASGKLDVIAPTEEALAVQAMGSHAPDLTAAPVPKETSRLMNVSEKLTAAEEQLAEEEIENEGEFGFGEDEGPEVFEETVEPLFEEVTTGEVLEPSLEAEESGEAVEAEA